LKLLPILSLVVTLSACGSGTAASAASTASGRAMTSSGQRATGLFGRRYCEVILLNTHSTPLTAQVWNTYPLNACPEKAWQAMDLRSVAKEHGSPLAVRNGPRYWAMDSITKFSSSPLVTRDIGGLEMHLDATLQLGSLSAAPYVAHAVDRDTVFAYRDGRQIYELHAPSGATYVMQSWSQQYDPTLAQKNLLTLGSQLKLPTGWSYDTRTLGAPLQIVATNAPAEVIQDSLGDSYSLES